MRKFAILGVLIFYLLPGGNGAATANQAAKEEDLVSTASDFLRTWLVQRDAARATKYLSAQPILGSCMTPQHLATKRNLTPKEISKVFHEALSIALSRTREAPGLEELLESPGVIPSNDNNVVFIEHSMPQYFQVLQLKSGKNPSDIAYICKFDERPSFRKAVARSNIYYLFAKVRGKESCPTLTVGLLWEKEGEHWRILTMSLAEVQ